MNVCIIGATGRVGNVLLKTSLAAGFSVNALVRDPNKINLTKEPNLNIIRGDALEKADLQTALLHADVVFCALNVGRNSTLSKSMPMIIDIMKEQGIKRIISIGTAGILQSRLEPGLFRYQSQESRNRSTTATEDHLYAYLQLSDSNLDWTVVCPTYLPDGERIGRYRYEKDYLPEGGKSISIYDTADFAFQQAFSKEFIRSRVGICY